MGLMEHLLYAALWHRRQETAGYEMESAELKRVLTIAPAAVRHAAAWHFYRLLRADDDNKVPPADRWRSDVGPLFRESWPRDAVLRDIQTSQRLASMAIEAGEAFSEVVETVVDYVVPIPVHFIRIELIDPTEENPIVRNFPEALLKLLDALIDATSEDLPSDLSHVLETCATSKPSVVSLSAYQRLDAAWKKKAR
jgi:hypothetical protein